ncbi:MAG: VWA domain-containing protein [Acidobacteria bacterium]|nr:VWA domain-containing protein [Acidobacteriota bacterium]MBI3424906.1 VWA domain-containing protein [Acidobacteriota bacterium]
MKSKRGKNPVVIGCLAVSLLSCLFVPFLRPLTSRAQSGRKPQQQPGQQPATEKPIARIETKEVIVPLSAYDAEGKLVSDLEPKDVLVLEDGEPRPVSYIRHEPANIVLMLDLNNELGTFKNGTHIRSRSEAEKEAASADKQKPMWHQQGEYQIVARPATREFADNLVKKLSPADSLAIIQYADKVQLVQDWTSDGAEALRALQAKYRIGLKGRYYDALKLAAEKLEERKTGRRIVILISDGLDSASKTNRQQAINALARAQATLYIVGWAEVLREEISIALQRVKANAPAGIDLLGNARKRIEELQRYQRLLEGAAIQLRDLAETTGGEWLEPPNYDELVNSPRRIAAEIGAQYSLAFITETRPSLDNTRAIEVLAARKGLTVRSRRSYWVGE